ncbi:DUF1802 family protein [Synechococcus sp. PCC 7336]|uniref:DUF1802 family protein n=1 Tax=Synechococcus sp. PCC 7336 TaxID=195250 RepID=UPI0003812942|nr:DUF1802 family protein [Synechococcus sp. PCC 7336]
MEHSLTTALKEWDVAVRALAAGDTILLLRKGGIREEGGQFKVEGDRVLLYPTYEHQKPHLLKLDYAARVQPVPSGWHPQTVEISAWADITEILAIDEAAPLARLLPHHIWNEQFATERFNWKPRQPLYLLLLQVSKLPQPIHIPYCSEYGGCRSWLDLAASMALTGSERVLSDGDYDRRVDAIRGAIA